MWKTFAKLQGKDFEDMPVILEDIQFHRATIMPKEGKLHHLIAQVTCRAVTKEPVTSVNNFFRMWVF